MPTYTVTIAGPERHEGHSPYDYVLTTPNEQDAQTQALNHHKQTQETQDAIILKITPGIPTPNYNDLRPPTNARSILKIYEDYINDENDADPLDILKDMAGTLRELIDNQNVPNPQ